MSLLRSLGTLEFNCNNSSIYIWGAVNLYRMKKFGIGQNPNEFTFTHTFVGFVVLTSYICLIIDIEHYSYVLDFVAIFIYSLIFIFININYRIMRNLSNNPLEFQNMSVL